MRKEDLEKSRTDEGLADLAQRAESDHEVQMARADLYKIAKYAIKLHDMLKGVSEQEGLEGWQQAKITKAADYIGSVYHNLDYDLQFKGGALGEGEYANDAQRKAVHAAKDEKKKKKAKNYKESLQDRLAEKKLTPAELKKREEIAKAIEKDDPDMPMSKKMAIATAQAKKSA